jgi:uncharacterized protein with WD repeat
MSQNKKQKKKNKTKREREREREREKGFTLAKSSPRSKNFIECIILNWHVFKMYIKIM